VTSAPSLFIGCGQVLDSQLVTQGASSGEVGAVWEDALLGLALGR